MEKELKEKILAVIEKADNAYALALKPENREYEGYAFAAGYQRASLQEIRYLLDR